MVSSSWPRTERWAAHSSLSRAGAKRTAFQAKHPRSTGRRILLHTPRYSAQTYLQSRALPGRTSGAQVTCLNLAGYGLRGAALGLNNILGAPLLPPLAFLQGLDLHNNQLWGAAPSPSHRNLAVHALSEQSPAVQGPLPSSWPNQHGLKSCL